jgi:hypothetical protein
MAKVNYNRFKTTANEMIAKWGMRAVLRRSSGDRDCMVVITSYNPMERVGQMRNPLDRKVLLSVEGLTLPPDQEHDRLVTFVDGTLVVDEVLKIIEPPGKIAMAGETVFYRLSVRK